MGNLVDVETEKLVCVCIYIYMYIYIYSAALFGFSNHVYFWNMLAL